LARAAVTAGFTEPDRIVLPWVAWRTTWSPSPEAAGKFLVNRPTAACESVLGRLKFELNLLPLAELSPITTTAASNHPVTTILRCRKLQ
jgi:hypothetical protein